MFRGDISNRKFVYQKDMSEYCRRRVLPAVFLGKQVMEANSQILHFSRLEMPYSCFINVRTEMGSNIIVVIQVVIDIDLHKSCIKGDHQLLIHELGETYGGYWGQLPDSVLKTRRNRNDNSYTLSPIPTEPPTTTTEQTTTTSSTELTTVTRDPNEDKKREEANYIRVEVPVLNVSANIVPGQIGLALSFTKEDTFDEVYDVTPSSGVSYETSVVPILELNMKEGKGSIRYDNKSDVGDMLSKFAIELNNIFTPDPRLMTPDYVDKTHKRKLYKFRPNVNKKLDFKKHKNLFEARRTLYTKRRTFANIRRPQLKTVQPNNYVSKLHSVKHASTHTSKSEEAKETSTYWDAIHAILKNLSKTADISTEPPHEELANFLRGAKNKIFNQSAYLYPGISHIDVPIENVSQVPVRHEQKHTEYSLTKISPDRATDTTTTSVSHDSNKSNDRINNTVYAIDHDDGVTVALLPVARDVDSIILNVINKKKTDTRNDQGESSKVNIQSTTPALTSGFSKLSSPSLALVDHESFENVVQSASAMVDKLNHTKVTDEHKTKLDTNIPRRRRRRYRKRKKRYLQAIAIDGAKPHQIHEMKHATTTIATQKFNKRQFQQLFELQDDEISDRVAMRYLPRMMGKPVLDFCNFNETTTKYVFLFNSSRLVLALSNFTMKRLTIILTPSRTLRNNEGRCGEAQLECQISGARVCIDSLSACDGVPNCGSNDIYDEDRLTCGAATGFRHNVGLAAITCLAVLLTVLYIIHYWLKRCIPRVSEAFFIYTDAAENVLYLDTIMRSPYDMGLSKEYYRDVQRFLDNEKNEITPNFCNKFITRCLTFLRLKRKKPAEDVAAPDFVPMSTGKLSPFAELEIQNMTSGLASLQDAAVQTGSSLLEHAMTSSIHSPDFQFAPKKFASSSMDHAYAESNLAQASDELNVLQFLRKLRARSVSVQQDSEFNMLGSQPEISSMQDIGKEKEIASELLYDPTFYSVAVHEELKNQESIRNIPEKPSLKHLRFQEDALIMSPKDDEVAGPSMIPRRSIVYGATSNKVFRIQEPEEYSNDMDEPGTGGRELKSYFNWGKEKKKKKPKRK